MKPTKGIQQPEAWLTNPGSWQQHTACTAAFDGIQILFYVYECFAYVYPCTPQAFLAHKGQKEALDYS